MTATLIYEAHPAMFRAHPFWFIGCVLLIPAFGIGILLLLYRYINTRATALTVTDNELLYERGILSKDRTSVSLKHIRSVHITQGFLNRILGVGTIQVSTAGDEPEFTMADMPDPGEIKDAISKAQDKSDDKDSARTAADAKRERPARPQRGVAAAHCRSGGDPALIVIGGAGIYFIIGFAARDLFSAGLGLKNAAIDLVRRLLAVILDHGGRVRGRCYFRRAALYHRRASRSSS